MLSTAARRATITPVARARSSGSAARGRCSNTRVPSTASTRCRWCQHQVLPRPGERGVEQAARKRAAAPMTIRVLSVWWTTTLSMTSWVNSGVVSPSNWITSDASARHARRALLEQLGDEPAEAEAPRCGFAGVGVTQFAVGVGEADRLAQIALREAIGVERLRRAAGGLDQAAPSHPRSRTPGPGRARGLRPAPPAALAESWPESLGWAAAGASATRQGSGSRVRRSRETLETPARKPKVFAALEKALD